MFGQPGASQRYSVSASSRPSGAKRSVLIVTRGIDPPASDAFKWRSNWLLAFLRASAHFGALGLAGWSISLTELCKVLHNSSSQESGFYEAYVGFARALPRVAHLLRHRRTGDFPDERGRREDAVFQGIGTDRGDAFLGGVAVQVVLALLY